MKTIFLFFFNLISLLNYTQERIVSVKSLQEFLEIYPSKIKECTHKYEFSYEPFSLRNIYGDHLWHHQGIFQDIFILETENAIAYINSEKKEGDKYHHFFYINNIFIKECTEYNIHPQIMSFHDDAEIQNIKGRVAVAYHFWWPEYGHFMLNVLSSLALLEIYNIEYDYLLIPCEYGYMKEILNLWGIDQSKIISPKDNHPIQADTLIFSTQLGIMINKPYSGFGAYHIDFLIQYIREKLISAVNKLNLSIPYSSKIFLSKKDTVMGGRTIPNEDDVFKEFEKLGYKRYEFAKMSITEKIYRATHASHLISATGSGGLHAIFIQPGGYYFEIQTTYPESTFCYLVQDVGINYRCLDCTTLDDLLYNNWLMPGKDISINFIKDYIKNHPEL